MGVTTPGDGTTVFRGTLLLTTEPIYRPLRVCIQKGL